MVRMQSGHVDAALPVDRGDADLSVIGAALSDHGRTSMLLALTDGRALPASVLAAEAGVSPSSASAHLRKLCDAGLLEVDVRGRFRYYRLAGDEVGNLIEILARLSPTRPIRSLREGTRAHAIRLARCCYNHIAGRLGVALTDALVDHGYLGDRATGVEQQGPQGGRLGGVGSATGIFVTGAGRDALSRLGVELPRDDVVRCCMDWTEQRPHIAGAHGRALLNAFTGKGWIRPAERSRALSITATGRRQLQAHLGMSWPPPTGSPPTSSLQPRS